jgi:hypothetical protein
VPAEQSVVSEYPLGVFLLYCGKVLDGPQKRPESPATPALLARIKDVAESPSYHRGDFLLILSASDSKLIFAVRL